MLQDPSSACYTKKASFELRSVQQENMRYRMAEPIVVLKMKMYAQTAQSRSNFVFWKGKALN